MKGQMAVFSLFWHEQDRGGGADECGTEMGNEGRLPTKVLCPD